MCWCFIHYLLIEEFSRLPRTQEFFNQQIFYRIIDLLLCNIITQVTICTIITYMYSQYYCTNYCKRYGIPECTRYQIVLGQFIRGPADDSKESKHVARKWQSIINLLCFEGICISLLANKSGCHYRCIVKSPMIPGEKTDCQTLIMDSCPEMNACAYSVSKHTRTVTKPLSRRP